MIAEFHKGVGFVVICTDKNETAPEWFVRMLYARKLHQPRRRLLRSEKAKRADRAIKRRYGD